MLLAVLVLMGCQLIGQGLRDALDLPVPGPVVGMFLLATVLVCRGGKSRIPSPLETTAETLISCMGLLFVPAGVGIIAEAPLLGRQWFPIAAAVIGSTVLSLGVTGLVMHRAARWSEKRRAREAVLVIGETPVIRETSSCRP